MKTRHLLLAGILFLSATLSIFSCKKQSATEQVNEESLKVEQLALKYTSPIGDNYKELVAQFSSLNLNELKQFWIKINKINRHTVNLTQQQIEGITAWVENYNNASLSKFGIPFNKISASQLHDIVYDASNRTKDNVSSFKPPIDPPPPTECILYSYPLRFYPFYSGTYYSPAASFYTDVNDVYQDPNYSCPALEYCYSGTQWSAMYPLTPLAAQCMGYNGGWGWHVRVAGGYTRVFAPKTFVIGWFGSFAAFNDNVRLTISFVE